jgi:hypothetical protein
MFEPYFERSRFILSLANCLEVLAGIDENSVDMVFAEPLIFLTTRLPAKAIVT